MTYDPYGPSGSPPKQDRYIDNYRDQSSMWGLGALAVLVALGVMLWAFSGDNNTNTAQRSATENTGTMSRSAPPPAAQRRTPPAAPSTDNTGSAQPQQ